MCVTVARRREVPGERVAIGVRDVSGPSHLAQRSRDVEMLDQPMLDTSRYAAWWPDDERHPYRWLVEDHLLVHAVVAHHLAVVGGVDDPGVVQHAAPLQRRQD